MIRYNGMKGERRDRSDDLRTDPENVSLRLNVTDFRLNGWIVRPSLNQIECDATIAHLQHLSMRVLCYLADRAGTLVTYDELLSALWPGRVVSEDAVHRRVADLRRRLGDDARSPRFIETIIKQGYRLISRIEPASPGVRRQSRAQGQRTDALIVEVFPETKRACALVEVRRHDEPDAEWHTLGTTPLSDRLPEGTWTVRLSVPAYGNLASGGGESGQKHPVGGRIADAELCANVIHTLSEQ